MNKITSFLAGAICGALIGAVTGLLLTPAAGSDLQGELRQRLDSALEEGKAEMARTQRDLAAQFEVMKKLK